MRIWLYSSGDLESNQVADQDLLSQIDSRNPSLCFIPSAYDDTYYYYDEFRERFSHHRNCQFNIFHIDRPYKNVEMMRALRSDMIYLSGGNTFYFLKHIRQTGLEQLLWNYLQEGGIVAGHSAGAIVMTPTIHTASYPEDDRDDNDVRITNFRAMNYCRFEIFPHFRVRSRTQNAALKEASKNLNHIIYALPDGAAIAVDGNALTIYGPVWGFTQGQRFQIKI